MNYAHSLGFALMTSLLGCTAKIPEEYAALGIPPNAERVASIEKQENPDNTVYMITYEGRFDADAYVATNDKIVAAGYKMNERGDQFTGPKGTFRFWCGGDGGNRECTLTVPKK